jgi:NADH-quinone oxidoreductase subunit A
MARPRRKIYVSFGAVVKVPGMLEEYISIIFFVGIFMVIALGMLGLSNLVGPTNRGGRIKGEAYECGMDLIQPNARERYSIPFYLVAILFILFDVETVFLLPWAVGFNDLTTSMGGFFVVVEALVFLGILALGLIYVIYRGGLEWD